MRNINLSDKNIFDEKSAAFQDSKLAKRLERKFQPQPFEQRFKGVYWLSFAVSYLCNVFSVFAASTFVFVQICLLFASVPYSTVLAGIITAVLLIVIEVLQRILGPMLFKNLYQYGIKSGYSVMVSFILFLSVLSVTLSYKGGFDVVEKLTAKPVYQAPELINIDIVKSEYNTLINQAANDAENYKNASTYRGKLDAVRSNAYSKKLAHVADLRNKKTEALNSAKAKNREATQNAENEHAELLAVHASKVSGKGSNMAKGSIIAQIIFFLCIWFMEFYDYRTATQYAVADPAEKTDVFTKPETKIVQVKGFANTKQAAHKTPETVVKTIHTINAHNKQTITHEGKQYDRSAVSNRINIHQKRADEAREKGRIGTAERNESKLHYWVERLKEFE